jgi:hypothetical protein
MDEQTMELRARLENIRVLLIEAARAVHAQPLDAQALGELGHLLDVEGAARLIFAEAYYARRGGR